MVYFMWFIQKNLDTGSFGYGLGLYIVVSNEPAIAMKNDYLVKITTFWRSFKVENWPYWFKTLDADSVRGFFLSSHF